MKYERIAHEIYWAMEHGDTAEADRLIDDLICRGIKTYAYWKDGVQYVGTCGITLEDALTLTREAII